MSLDPSFYESMKQSPLFTGLNHDDFRQIVEHTSYCKLKIDESLFRQHQSATSFFMLLTGKIKLSLMSIDGVEKIVEIINPVNTFAEAIIFQGKTGYPVNAEALADSSLLKIDASAYIKTLENAPEACFKVMSALSMRVHWLLNELDQLSLHNATYRLISYLLENIPDDATEPTEVFFSVPKHVIASRLSITPETLSRTLKSLSEQDLVTIHNTHLVLDKPIELRNLVSIS